MNKIAEKQNEPDQFRTQYASHVFFDRAEVLNYIIWVLCLLSATMVFFSDSNNVIPLVIIFFSSILAVVLSKYMEKNVSIAADFRKLFDRNVFGLQVESVKTKNSLEKLAELREKVIDKNFRDFTIQSKNTAKDTPPGIKDWYSMNADISGTEAIFECQKENVWWDKKISSYQWLLYCAIAILLISEVILLFRAKSLNEGLIILLGEAGLFIKVCERIMVICQYKKASIQIETMIDSFDAFVEQKGVSMLQSKIEQRREIPITHINYIHRKAAKKWTELYTRIRR